MEAQLLAVVQDKQAVAPARALALETLKDLADPRRDEALQFAEATGNSFLAQAAERLRKKLNNTQPANPAVVLKKTPSARPSHNRGTAGPQHGIFSARRVAGWRQSCHVLFPAREATGARC